MQQQLGRERAGAALLLLVSGCGRDAGRAVPAAATDAAPQPGASAPCPTTANSDVVLDGRILGYAALGNIDIGGGESGCGGPHEGVEIVLAVDPGRNNLLQTARFTLTFPVAVGPQPITVFSGNGGAGAPATLNVTRVLVHGAGPDLDLIEGALTGAASGRFVSPQCPSLTTSCI